MVDSGPTAARRVAKALGDRRADVAARSFGKPLGKVIVRRVEVLGK